MKGAGRFVRLSDTWDPERSTDKAIVQLDKLLLLLHRLIHMSKNRTGDKGAGNSRESGWMDTVDRLQKTPELPRLIRVVTAGYPDLVPGEIPYPVQP